jgi:uncharacterized membrane protein YciS (DUF1049 family)
VRFLLWLISIPLTVFVILFAVSNPGQVSVSLMPLEGSYELSLATVGLGLMALGFLAGSIFVGIQGYRAQIRKWQETRRADRLEKELVRVKETYARMKPPTAVLPVLQK